MVSRPLKKVQVPKVLMAEARDSMVRVVLVVDLAASARAAAATMNTISKTAIWAIWEIFLGISLEICSMVRAAVRAAASEGKSVGVSVVDLGKEGDAGVLCAYNDIAFMVYFVQNGVDDLAGDVRKLFAQQSGESLMGDKAVAEQLARKNDINMVLSYGEILPMMNNPMLSSMPMMDALKGAMMVGSVNFEKGRIVTEAAVSYKDKESEAKMMDFYAYVKPQTGALLRYVPAASIGAMSLGINGEKLYSMLSAMPGYGMLMANPMVKQVMEPFDGDFLLSFSGMGIDGRYPVASMLAQVKDPAVLQTIVTNMAGMPVRQTAEGEYTLNMGGVTILFGVKGDVLYCTTDAVVKMALDGGEIASMESMDKIFKGQSSTFYLDFEGLNAMIAQLLGGNVTPQAEAALSVLGMFDDMEAYGTMKGGTMIVNMVDKEQNSFKTICGKTGELIRQYVPEANL